MNGEIERENGKEYNIEKEIGFQNLGVKFRSFFFLPSLGREV